MARAPLVLQSEFPYSVTARSNNQEWFRLPLENCWSIFENVIGRTAERYNFQTHQFVLMSNHYHWLVSTPDANLNQGMRYFMTESSRSIARATFRINKIFGARYKPCLITTPQYYAHSFRYIYQNPLRAGICKDLKTYKFSTYHPASKIKIFPKNELEEFVPEEKDILNRWLHELLDQPSTERIRKALRRRHFELPKHPTKRTKCELTP